MSLQVNESENTVSDVSNLTGMPENRIGLCIKRGA